MFDHLSLLRTGRFPKEPTPALPGSEEKILIMTERAARREQLFHPLDGRIPASAVAGPVSGQDIDAATKPAFALEPLDLLEVDDDVEFESELAEAGTLEKAS
jgi:hypothetical protein